ncbi:hypothetical protein RB195_013765 [Necator americanus]|uniref:Uncharacterized protein n=1 Tax=Necator americanus TaxID=51031 RepID=A0ABR1DXA2_NECAM
MVGLQNEARRNGDGNKGNAPVTEPPRNTPSHLVPIRAVSVTKTRSAYSQCEHILLRCCKQCSYSLYNSHLIMFTISFDRKGIWHHFYILAPLASPKSDFDRTESPILYSFSSNKTGQLVFLSGVLTWCA